jgi:hypothetical protein
MASTPAFAVPAWTCIATPVWWRYAEILIMTPPFLNPY